MVQERLSIGCGSADASERLDWPVELADSGLVSYMGFDSLAERTLAFAHARKMAKPDTGYNEYLPRTIPAFAPFIGRGGRIVTNQGGANPEAAGRLIVDGLRKLGGYEGKKVGIVYGDDCLQTVLDQDLELPELDSSVKRMGDRVVGAYAYIGAEPVVECLEQGADWVIGGRLADPSCYVGPVCHEMGWALDDWPRVGVATAVGHLLECGQHVTGGNYCDPARGRMFAGMERLGFPYATVEQDGSFVVSKLPGTGGGVTKGTVISQLTYEVHDPARYLTPDVTADFQNAVVEDLGNDRVRISGISGTARPDMLKVLVGIDWGHRVIGFTSFGGSSCVDRAKFCIEILQKRFEKYADVIHAMHFDILGYNALYGDAFMTERPMECQLRSTVLVGDKHAADEIAEEVSKQVVWITHGQGGTGALQNSRHIASTPVFLPRSEFTLTSEIVTV